MSDATPTAGRTQPPAAPSPFEQPAKPWREWDELVTQDASAEGRFDGMLGYKLTHGFDTDHGWLRLVHQNRPSRANDDAIYKTDFRFELDGGTCGFLDIELKPRWESGDWPYPKINIAKHPMAHWKRRRFGSRDTNKLRDFKQFPRTSLWVAVRRDYQAALLVRASDIFDHGIDTHQRTRMRDVSGDPLPALPIKEVALAYGRHVYDAEQMKEMARRLFEDAYAVR